MRLIQWFASVGRFGFDFRCMEGFSSKLPAPIATGSENLWDVTIKTQPQHFTNVS